MSEGWNIAILGATGAVGEALLDTLAERQFPVGEIFALARNESAGEHLRFNGKSVIVQDVADFDWTQAQLAFFVAGAEAPLHGWKKQPMPVAWLSTAVVCSHLSLTFRWWFRTLTRSCWQIIATAM